MFFFVFFLCVFFFFFFFFSLKTVMCLWPFVVYSNFQGGVSVSVSSRWFVLLV